MSEVPEYKLDRLFDAPRHLVWRAWTDPELLATWYGPNVETIIHQFDLKPGGLWLNEMKMRGNSDYSKMIFKEVTPPAKLVWHHCSTDANWNRAANPKMPDWPKVLLTTVLFEEIGEKTKVRLSQIPVEATDAEITCFANFMAHMDGGWGKGYAIIDDLLAKLQAAG